jgi:serine/threonine protein kinase
MPKRAMGTCSPTHINVYASTKSRRVMSDSEVRSLEADESVATTPCKSPQVQAPARDTIFGDTQFTLRQCVGRGAYGSVWSAVTQCDAADALAPPTHAVKIFDQFPCGPDATAKERDEREKEQAEDCDREAKTHSALLKFDATTAHAHVVVFTSSGFDAVTNLNYIVFPYTNNPTLDQFMRDRGGQPGVYTMQSFAIVKELAHSLFMGLEFLHAAGIIHRDISPSNIFVTQTGIKLLDLGLASTEEDAPLRPYVVMRWYRPFEVLIHAQQTTAIDIWSVSLLLQFMVHGKHMLPGDTSFEQLLLVLSVTGHVPPGQFELLTAKQQRAVAFAVRAAPTRARVNAAVQWKGTGRHPNFTSVQFQALGDLLFHMQSSDPLLRKSAHDLLADPFFNTN